MDYSLEKKESLAFSNNADGTVLINEQKDAGKKI